MPKVLRAVSAAFTSALLLPVRGRAASVSGRFCNPIHGESSLAATIRTIAKNCNSTIYLCLTLQFSALFEAREHDPFSVLGLHAHGAGWRLRVFLPACQRPWAWNGGARRRGWRLGAAQAPCQRHGLFEWQGE
jgi:hypothetical protein